MRKKIPERIPVTSNQGRIWCSSVQKNGTPLRYPRKSGGSPIGVSAPPMLETRKMKKTMWIPVMRYRFMRIQGRISTMEAPVVPMRLASTAPAATDTAIVTTISPNTGEVGTPATGVSQPTGGVGLSGWLSGIFHMIGSPFQAGGSIGNTAFGATQSGTWQVTPTVPNASTMNLTSTTTAYTTGQAAENSVSASANASWLLSATTISFASCPAGLSAGATIYDTTATHAIGSYASCTSGTMTLQAGALAASSGSADALVFVNNPSFAMPAAGGAIPRVRLYSDDTGTGWQSATVQIDLWDDAVTWANADHATWAPNAGATGHHLAAYSCTFPATVLGDGLETNCSINVGNYLSTIATTIFWSIEITGASGNAVTASKHLYLRPELN